MQLTRLHQIVHTVIRTWIVRKTKANSLSAWAMDVRRKNTHRERKNIERAWNGNCNYKKKKLGPLSDCFEMLEVAVEVVVELLPQLAYLHLTSFESLTMHRIILLACHFGWLAGYWVCVHARAQQLTHTVHLISFQLFSIYFFSLVYLYIQPLCSHVLCCRSNTMQLHFNAQIHFTKNTTHNKWLCE